MNFYLLLIILNFIKQAYLQQYVCSNYWTYTRENGEIKGLIRLKYYKRFENELKIKIKVELQLDANLQSVS